MCARWLENRKYFVCLSLLFFGTLLLISRVYAAGRAVKSLEQEMIDSRLAAIPSQGELENAPKFKLQDTDQNMVSLVGYTGRQPLVLMFWATWSPMSSSELSSLNNLYVGLSKEGIEVLAINSGELPDAVDNFLKSYFLAYRVLLDKDTTVTRAYKIEGFPQYVLVSKDGKIVFRDNYFPYDKYKKLLLGDEGG